MLICFHSSTYISDSLCVKSAKLLRVLFCMVIRCILRTLGDRLFYFQWLHTYMHTHSRGQSFVARRGMARSKLPRTMPIQPNIRGVELWRHFLRIGFGSVEMLDRSNASSFHRHRRPAPKPRSKHTPETRGPGPVPGRWRLVRIRGRRPQSWRRSSKVPLQPIHSNLPK